MSDERVKRAFEVVREGRAVEYVICDTHLNAIFLDTARQLGVKGSDVDINTALINLRKQNKLKDCPTTHRKKADPDRDRYKNSVLNVIRLVERQFGKTVDDIICDSDTRNQFDAMIQFLSPGASVFETRYAALSLRKSNQLKPEPVGQVIRAISSHVLSLLDLEDRLNELPTKQGVYIFFDEESTLYAGKAENLRSRIKDHISSWSNRDIIKQVRKEQRSQVFVVYHELPKISAKELSAYETELIRSRQPEHNRANKNPAK